MTTDSGIVLLLAAGQSRRFGSDKRTARLDAHDTVLSASIRRYRILDWPLYVVLGSAESGVQEATERALKAHGQSAPEWLNAPDAAKGMGHSLAAGIDALIGCGASAVLIGLGDMPFVESATIERCADTLTATQPALPDRIVRPRYRSQPGNPVGFAGAPLQALRASTGDVGARPVLQAHADVIQWVDVEDPGILRDIDRPEDLPEQ